MMYTGEVFLFWRGVQPAIRIADPKLAKQILSDKSGAYAQPQFDHRLLSFAGNGVGQLNGPDWVRHRSILTPAFTKDKLKVSIEPLILTLYISFDVYYYFNLLSLPAYDKENGSMHHRHD